MSSKIPPLYAHQVKSIKTFLPIERGFDASDPGTGKTRVQIDRFALRRKKGSGCQLVIAPKSLLKNAWANDYKKYAPHITTSIATATNREKAFDAKADVYITNIDAVLWLARQPATFFKRFDDLVIDEISAFKHHTSKRSRAINKVKKYFKYRYGLTGTPNANGIANIWHQIFILDDGKRLGKSFFAFRGSVCTPTQVGPSANMLRWDDRPGAEMAVGSLLQDMIVRHKFEECIDIPPNSQHIINYGLTPKQAKAYGQMEKAAIIQMQNKDIISALNAAGIANKLLQIASGAAYNEAGEYTVVDTERYELITELVEERESCVVFFNWTHQRDGIIKAFEKAGITYTVIDGDASDNSRTQSVDFFQKGLYRVLLAHPASAAHGLTLTRGTTTIWASPTYNLEHFLQGNKRIYRAGQTKKTETIVVVAEGTIEETVMAKLEAKNVKQLNLLELMKELFA